VHAMTVQLDFLATLASGKTVSRCPPSVAAWTTPLFI
jgi:hypothetical protein